MTFSFHCLPLLRQEFYPCLNILLQLQLLSLKEKVCLLKEMFFVQIHDIKQPNENCVFSSYELNKKSSNFRMSVSHLKTLKGVCKND